MHFQRDSVPHAVPLLPFAKVYILQIDVLDAGDLLLQPVKPAAALSGPLR
jgi:hypothetical protein